MHDHRRLGRELELFDTDPLIGAGLPYWLPVSDAQAAQAEALARHAANDGLRAVVAGPESGGLGARIWASRLVPYQAVIGAREAAAGQAALRLRDGRQIPPRPVGEVLAGIGERVAAHSPEMW